VRVENVHAESATCT